MRKRKSRYFSIVGLGLILLFLITGCASTESSPSWDSYVGSSLEKSFPIPKEAKKTDVALNNSKLDYVNYSLKGLSESDGVPEPYDQAITQWGWVEETAESTGTTRVYKKDKLTVQLTIHDHMFTVLVPKKQDRAVIQGLESSP